LAAAAAANFLIRVAVPQTWRGQKQTTSPGSAALETQNARASIRPGRHSILIPFSHKFARRQGGKCVGKGMDERASTGHMAREVQFRRQAIHGDTYCYFSTGP
jgi:hypothetical protein